MEKRRCERKFNFNIDIRRFKSLIGGAQIGRQGQKCAFLAPKFGYLGRKCMVIAIFVNRAYHKQQWVIFRGSTLFLAVSLTYEDTLIDCGSDILKTMAVSVFSDGFSFCERIEFCCRHKSCEIAIFFKLINCNTNRFVNDLSPFSHDF